jgi:hypothetical protein
MAISHYLIANPVLMRPRMPTLDEFMDDITTGAREFIAGIQTQLAYNSMLILTDLASYHPSDPNAEQRWQIIIATMSEPGGFQPIVCNMIKLTMLRGMIQTSGDPTGVIQSQINNIRAAIIYSTDRFIAPTSFIV